MSEKPINSGAGDVPTLESRVLARKVKNMERFDSFTNRKRFLFVALSRKTCDRVMVQDMKHLDYLRIPYHADKRRHTLATEHWVKYYRVCAKGLRGKKFDSAVFVDEFNSIADYHRNYLLQK